MPATGANNGRWGAELDDRTVFKKRKVILDMRSAHQAPTPRRRPSDD
ncbi:hypothetical protein [Streptomyces mexicanus]